MATNLTYDEQLSYDELETPLQKYEFLRETVGGDEVEIKGIMMDMGRGYFSSILLKVFRQTRRLCQVCNPLKH